jgi:hypothetical protein
VSRDGAIARNLAVIVQSNVLRKITYWENITSEATFKRHEGE